MSKLVEIKAEYLKWCPYMLCFEYNGCTLHYRHVLADKVKADSWYGPIIGAVEIGFDETVQVNPKEYEQAVINRIKEMIQTKYTQITKITKRKGMVRVFLEEWSKEDLDSDGNCLVFSQNVVRLNADPRPHEETYTIYLQEEDNE